jgi:hypothetical protein
MRGLRNFQQARKLNLERQRYYDAFKILRAGESIPEFHFTLNGKKLIAKDIRPFVGDETLSAIYYVGWFLCHFGRGSERGPRICMLDFKDTGNPRPYSPSEAGFGNFMRRDQITCPLKHVFGLVWGGIWREDGTQDPWGPPLPYQIERKNSENNGTV